MKIGICDDNKLWLENARDIIEDYGKKKDIQTEIVLFDWANDLLQEMASLDMIFMDIELKEQNGIEVVKKINYYNPACFVVYLTNYLYYVSDVYDSRHDYFVLKEQFVSKLDKIFDLYKGSIKRQQHGISVMTTDRSVISIPVNQIIYLERSERVTRIITIEAVYMTKIKIEKLAEQLEAFTFIRCHKSFLLNPFYIKESRKELFRLVNDTEVFISQRYRKSSREAYLNWSASHFL